MNKLEGNQGEAKEEKKSLENCKYMHPRIWILQPI